MVKLGIIPLARVTRALKSVRGLHSPAYCVGGIVTESYTLRDIDIVIGNMKDIPIIKKALGSLASRTHFIFQRSVPSGSIYLTITGKEPKNATQPEPNKKFRYAVPEKLEKY